MQGGLAGLGRIIGPLLIVILITIKIFILGESMTKGELIAIIFAIAPLRGFGVIGMFGKNFLSRLALLFLSSIIFFMCSNFGVWVFSEFYTKDLEGLLQCYVLAIPFFTNTIISTFVFGILFEISIMSKNKVTSLLYK